MRRKPRPCVEVLIVLLVVWLAQPRKPLAKIFTFHKDESTLIEDWLAYHTSLVGPSNVVVVDHASKEASVVRTLAEYAQRGVTVVPFEGSFRDKAKALSAVMRVHSNARLLIPIDADEFVISETGSVHEELWRLALSDETRKFKFASRVAKCPEATAEGRPARATRFSPPVLTSMAKTFYRGETFVATDQGNHYGDTSKASQDEQLKPRNFDAFFVKSKLTLLHFTMPDFATWYAKVFSRAQAYGFGMHTNCEGVRKGQRYCRSFQRLKNGASPREEYRDVCQAITTQQNRLVDRQPTTTETIRTLAEFFGYERP